MSPNLLTLAKKPFTPWIWDKFHQTIRKPELFFAQEPVPGIYTNNEEQRFLVAIKPNGKGDLDSVFRHNLAEGPDLFLVPAKAGNLNATAVSATKSKYFGSSGSSRELRTDEGNDKEDSREEDMEGLGAEYLSNEYLQAICGSQNGSRQWDIENDNVDARSCSINSHAEDERPLIPITEEYSVHSSDSWTSSIHNTADEDTTQHPYHSPPPTPNIFEDAIYTILTPWGDSNCPTLVAPTPLAASVMGTPHLIHFSFGILSPHRHYAKEYTTGSRRSNISIPKSIMRILVVDFSEYRF
jgi:hypothetical protein